MVKELEMRQEDISDLEQALHEAQICISEIEDQAKQDVNRLQEEVDRMVQENFHLQEKASKLERQCTSILRASTQKTDYTRKGGSSGRSHKGDYFSMSWKPNTDQSFQTNRSQSQKRLQETSYTRMCREFEMFQSLEYETFDDAEKLSKLQQLVSHYRSQAKRIEVQYRDLKLKYTRDTEKLQAQLK